VFGVGRVGQIQRPLQQVDGRRGRQGTHVTRCAPSVSARRKPRRCRIAVVTVPGSAWMLVSTVPLASWLMAPALSKPLSSSAAQQ
jgi:hypothetical protein